MRFTKQELIETIECIEWQIKKLETHTDRCKHSRISDAHREILDRMDAKKKRYLDLVKKYQAWLEESEQAEQPEPLPNNICRKCGGTAKESTYFRNDEIHHLGKDFKKGETEWSSITGVSNCLKCTKCGHSWKPSKNTTK